MFNKYTVIQNLNIRENACLRDILQNASTKKVIRSRKKFMSGLFACRFVEEEKAQKG
jgi:hypothetical protein